jgi:hypothetical protein
VFTPVSIRHARFTLFRMEKTNDMLGSVSRDDPSLNRGRNGKRINPTGNPRETPEAGLQTIAPPGTHPARHGIGPSRGLTLTTICCVCHAHVRGPWPPRDPISHGLCKPCTAVAMADAEAYGTGRRHDRGGSEPRFASLRDEHEPSTLELRTPLRHRDRPARTIVGSYSSDADLTRGIDRESERGRRDARVPPRSSPHLRVSALHGPVRI